MQVRTSGVRLLFDIMTRHGAALSGEEGRVWDMAFPLLMEVAKNAHLSDEAHRLAAGPMAAKPRSVRTSPCLCFSLFVGFCVFFAVCVADPLDCCDRSISVNLVS